MNSLCNVTMSSVRNITREGRQGLRSSSLPAMASIGAGRDCAHVLSALVVESPLRAGAGLLLRRSFTAADPRCSWESLLQVSSVAFATPCSSKSSFCSSDYRPLLCPRRSLLHRLYILPDRRCRLLGRPSPELVLYCSTCSKCLPCSDTGA